MRLRGLGTTQPGVTFTPAQAAAQCQKNTNSNPGNDQDTLNLMIASCQAGQVLTGSNGNYVAFNPAGISGCNGVAPAGGANLQLVSTGTGLALTAASTVGAIVGAGSVVPIIGSIVGAIVGLFVAIFQHHSMVNAKILNDVCSLVPAANNYFAIIQQAVQSGQQTPAQAVQALQSLQSDFNTQANKSGVYKNCNALCVYNKCVCAIVNYLTSIYQNMDPAAPVAITPASGAAPGTPAVAQADAVAAGTLPAAVASTGFSTTELLAFAALAYLAFS